MNKTYFCFGEILWDLLPSGKHAGGAPFNVAVHLSQLRVPSALISAVGHDALGDEMLAVAGHKSVNTDFVVRAGLPTGTVNVAIDAHGNASYTIVRPVAWDEIVVPAGALVEVGRSAALVFGSLAARSDENLKQLDRLLATPGPLKFFDVNLRPPFDELDRVVDLARRVDVIKLNHDEAARLSAYVRRRPLVPWPATPEPDAVADACAAIAEALDAKRICVTMAAAGAAMWDDGRFLHAPAPAVQVRDTVGAGDAFMAGLVVGLVHGTPCQTILDTAVRLGGFVASHHGATPVLPPELVTEVVAKLTGQGV